MYAACFARTFMSSPFLGGVLLAMRFHSECPQTNPTRNLVSHFTELSKFDIWITGGFGGIIKAPVDQSGSRKGRAPFLCPITKRDDEIKLLIDEQIDIFGLLLPDVDVDFVHHLDCSWMNASRLGTSAVSDVFIPR